MLEVKDQKRRYINLREMLKIIERVYVLNSDSGGTSIGDTIEMTNLYTRFSQYREIKVTRDTIRSKRDVSE